jgi:hypothetical protein
MACLVLVFFLTAAAFGVPLQAAVDLLPPGNAALNFVGLLIACAAALGSYALAVRLGEGRRVGELALRPALSGLAIGVVLGWAMMTVVMGVRSSPVSTEPFSRGLGVRPAWSAR